MSKLAEMLMKRLINVAFEALTKLLDEAYRACYGSIVKAKKFLFMFPSLHLCQLFQPLFLIMLILIICCQNLLEECLSAGRCCTCVFCNFSEKKI